MATIQNEHPEFEKFENCTNQQFGLHHLFWAAAPEGTPRGTLRGLAQASQGLAQTSQRLAQTSQRLGQTSQMLAQAYQRP